ncbi:MAG: protein kinase [Planctomycetales bacterium]|nr:protein kinase [Planctomycetales bacterium]
MKGTQSDSEVLSNLAHDYSERVRRGESLTIHDYALAHPRFAAEIEDLFPAMLLLEQMRSGNLTCRSDSHSKSATPVNMPDRVGDFRLVRFIGAGGMGQVFEAIQVPLGRSVALKILPKRHCDSRMSERFAREAQVVARLHHTNIVPVFAYGDDHNFLYYAMQLIEGRSLDYYLRAAHFPTAEIESNADRKLSEFSGTARFGWNSNITDSGWLSTWETSPERFCHTAAYSIAQVADGLAHAHASGVIHRDIKPANLLVDQQGRFWITDFGLANLRDASELTLAHEMIGTLRYMPPERFRGQHDARGDVYSLGVTLHELLTRQQAFGGGDHAEIMQRILTQSMRPLLIGNKRVPRDLETIVHKAMARDPLDRYQTASEMADDLFRFHQDQPVMARRHTLPERAWRWSRRNQSLAWTGGLAIIAVLAFALVSSLAYQREKRMRAELQDALHNVQAAEARGRADLFESYVAGARAAQYSRREGQRLESLAAVRRAGELLPNLVLSPKKRQQYRESLCDLAVSALALPDIRVAGEIPSGVVIDVYRLDRSARRDATGALVVCRWPNGAELTRLSDIGERTDFRFTPERDVMVLFDRETKWLYQWKLGAAAPVRVAQSGQPGSILKDWAFDRDGRKVILTHQIQDDRLIEVLEWPSGHMCLRRALPYDDASLTVAGRISPNGAYLATIEGSYGASGSHLVRVTELESESELVSLKYHESVDSLAWHSDSETLAVGLADSNDIVLWNVPERKELRILKDQRGGGPKLCINASGELMCSFSSWANRLSLWHPYTGYPLLSVTGTSHFEWSSVGGTLIGGSALANGRWQLVLVEPSPVMRTLARNPKEGTGEAWRNVTVHPAGRLVAVGSDHGVSLFDLQTGQDVGYIPAGYALHPVFIPENGDLLTYSEQGVQRWPVQFADPHSSDVVVGPPLTLPLPCPATVGCQVSCDPTGNVIAVAARRQAIILQDFGKGVVRLEPLVDCRKIVVSPNGCWVVTANHTEGPLDVWDAKTGVRLRRLSEQIAESNVCFSPDSQYLCFLNMKPQLISTETWREHRLKDASDIAVDCISPDGKLAIDFRGGVTLREFRTGRKLVALSLPDAPTIWHSTFTPEGNRVILSSNDRQVCYVWDLRALADHLAELGLDGHANDIMPSATKAIPSSLIPLSVHVLTEHAAATPSQSQPALN